MQQITFDTVQLNENVGSNGLPGGEEETTVGLICESTNRRKTNDVEEISQTF